MRHCLGCPAVFELMTNADTDAYTAAAHMPTALPAWPVTTPGTSSVEHADGTAKLEHDVMVEVEVEAFPAVPDPVLSGDWRQQTSLRSSVCVSIRCVAHRRPLGVSV